jgi:hypothetical protein
MGAMLTPFDAQLVSCLAELEKVGAVSADQARRSLDRLDTLEQNKPTVGQVARYGTLGAGAGALTKGISSVVEHGKLPTSRAALASGAAGAIGMGAVPLLRSALDRRAETGTLKKFMAGTEQHAGDYAKSPGLVTGY